MYRVHWERMAGPPDLKGPVWGTHQNEVQLLSRALENILEISGRGQTETPHPSLEQGNAWAHLQRSGSAVFKPNSVAN